MVLPLPVGKQDRVLDQDMLLLGILDEGKGDIRLSYMVLNMY
jgi:hypothetical protein